MKKFQIEAVRVVREHTTVVVRAKSQAAAEALWDAREDDNAFGAFWIGGNIDREYIDSVHEVGAVPRRKKTTLTPTMEAALPPHA
jgi:hypothetical protein